MTADTLETSNKEERETYVKREVSIAPKDFRNTNDSGRPKQKRFCLGSNLRT